MDAEQVFFEKLASSSLGGDNSERLKLLGKQAVRRWADEDASTLTDAVRSVVSDEDLSREQVQRVAEAANQAAWAANFHDGGDSDTHFAPADADQVLEGLAPQAERSATPLRTDYLDDPIGEQLPPDTLLDDAFRVEKAASVRDEYPALNPNLDASQQLIALDAAVDFSGYTAERLQSELPQLGESVYQHIKQAHLRDGLGILQIGNAIASVTEDPAFAHEVIKAAAARLEASGVPIDERTEQTKLAQAVVINTEHPLLAEVVRFEQLAKTAAKLQQSQARLSAARKNVHGYLRDKLRGA